MAKPRKDSRRQQLITLRVGESLIFPKIVKDSVSAQLGAIKDSTGQRYSYQTKDKSIIVTRTA